jgi:CheY-like chemotaxis protein
LNPGPAADQRFTLRSPDGPGADAGHQFVSILLVEDNPADVRLVRAALEEHGIPGELIVFSDGEKAIQFIEGIEDCSDPCPDLMILDLNLPKRPGREVLRCRDQSGKLRNIPVVVLSSSDAARDREESARLGADLYLQKPSHLDEFLRIGQIVREMLAPRLH